MKKIMAFMALSLLLLPCLLVGQRPDEDNQTELNDVFVPKYGVKLNGLALIGVANPAFEVALNDNFSLQAEGIGIFYRNGFLGSDKVCEMYGAFLEGRYYIQETFKGFFVGVNTGYAHWALSKGIVPNWIFQDSDNTVRKGDSFMLGLTLGWSFEVASHWRLEPVICPGYNHAWYDIYSKETDELLTEGRSTNHFMIANKVAFNVVYLF